MQECNQLANISRLAESAVRGPSRMNENDDQTTPFASIEQQIKLAGIESGSPKMIRPTYEREEEQVLNEIRYPSNTVANQIARDIEAGAWTGLMGLRTPGMGAAEWEQIAEIKRAVMDELDRKLAAVSGNTGE